MELDRLRDYCLAKRAVTEELPFGPDTLVFKVADKLFALTGLADDDLRINLKCDPQRAVELRERYPEVIVPGWHMNKRHWNTVYVERGALDDRLVEELIDQSYALVVAGLTRRVRGELGLG
ncbi:MmcQ/YjbR family DNA-binding protein [Neolewinella sp.]|uniref:MmcQ/YjbR family DNA-binding protein n=1 Tax=Neolewinella sp. TaxID=2993543 RepID=UPI003B51A689